MSRTFLLGAAKSFAEMAHRGQVDKAGRPYFEHVCAVADGVDTEDEKVVAYLHDVIEDTVFRLEELIVLGIPEDLLVAIVLLTKTPTVPEQTYYEMIKDNELARVVKLSDLRHNMQIDRIPNPGPKDYKRLEKYQTYYNFLSVNVV